MAQEIMEEVRGWTIELRDGGITIGGLLDGLADGTYELEWGWIKPSEELPERNEDILINLDDGRIVMGYWDGIGWLIYNFDEEEVSLRRIIAWKHLPEPYLREAVNE